MTFAATKQNRKQVPAPSTPQPASKPILGVDLKGELIDVALEHVIDPAGPSDRLARPGDDTAIAQLARSMSECGQLQPVMLERLVDGRFCRVFGRRRIAAARSLGWKTIRASVIPPLADDVRRTVVAIENVQRQDLTPAEETLAVDELMLLQAFAAGKRVKALMPMGRDAGRVVDDALIEKCLASGDAVHFRKLLLDVPAVRLEASEQVAAMLGKPASWVRDRLYIGRLGERAKELVLKGNLPLAHAREISKVADSKRRDELAKDYAAGGSYSISKVEAGKLEDLQEEVRRNVFSLHVVPWQRHVVFAGKPACDGCPHNSATHPGLFEGGGDVSLTMVGGRGTYDSASASTAKVAAAGICTLPSCYADKLRAAKTAISGAAKRIVDSGAKPAAARVPEFVAPAALEAKVNDQRKLKKSGASRSASRKKAAPTAAEKAAEALRDAKAKWHDAMRAKADELEPKIAAAVLKTPGLWTVYTLLRKTKLFESTQHHQSEKARRAAESPAMATMLKLLAKPSWETVLKLEKDCGRRYGILDNWRDGPSGMALKLAAALGIEVEPEPKVEDFLPKDQRPTAAVPESSATSKAGRSTKRSGKKASPVPKASDDDVPAFDDGDDQ